MKQPDRHILSILLILILAFSAIGCSRNIPSAKPYFAQERDSRWVNDLTYLEKTLPQVHKKLFFQLSEEEFHRQLTELKNQVPVYTDQQIEIALSVILAGIGDTHTGSNIGAQFRYPLDLHWFAEGIYITGTSEEYTDLLGSRILTLNGGKIEEAAQVLKPVLGNANESWFKTQVGYYLILPEILQYFGLSTSEEIKLGVQLKTGEEQEIKLTPVRYPEYVAADRPGESVPLYRSHPDENYWYEYIADEKMIYFNYQLCQQMREKPFEIFAQELWDFVSRHEVEKLVLDIRDNRGGRSLILDSFIKELKKSSFNEPGRLYVIIGRDTYSSAILNAIRLQKETKAYFVGEATGGEPNHYGEVKQFTLPNSGIPIRYSTKYFHWVDEDINTLVPDKVIEETFESYRRGEDPVMNWIAEQIQA